MALSSFARCPASKVIRAEAKERQGKRNDIRRDNIQENLPECSEGQSRDKLGAMAGVSGKSGSVGL